MRHLRPIVSLATLLVSACAMPAPTPEGSWASKRTTATETSELQQRYDDEGRPLERRSRPSPPPSVPRVIAAPSEAPPAPRPRRERRDVQLRDARLDDALRMLAEAANVGLVLPHPLPQRVRLELRAVDPLDAIEMLAAAHHLQVRWQGRVLLVGVSSDAPKG